MIILTDKNKTYKKIYLVNEAYIYLLNKYRNFILYKYYSYHEYKKFKNSYIKYYHGKNNKLFSIRYFNYLNKWHRKDGPAWIQYYNNGKISFKEYYLNDIEYSYDEYLLKIKEVVSVDL